MAQMIRCFFKPCRRRITIAKAVTDNGKLYCCHDHVTEQLISERLRQKDEREKQAQRLPFIGE